MVQSIWVPVIAALGASALTTVGLLIRDVVIEKRKRTAQRLAAYEGLLAQSMVVVQAATVMRLTMKMRSGLTEGLDVALRYRKPVDPFELGDRLIRDFQPLFRAWTNVWARGSQEAILLANSLVDRCTGLVGVASAKGRRRNGLSGFLKGERWTREQEKTFMDAVSAVGESRRNLANLLRREGGRKSAEFSPLSEPK